MKKRGFTLIELLAVIVILAVIALIATPMILGVIDSAKKGAVESTAYGIISATEAYYGTASLGGGTPETSFDLKTDNLLKYKGSRPDDGELYIRSDGKISIAVSQDGWCAIKRFSEKKVQLSKTTNCTTGENPNGYAIGEEITFKNGDIYNIIEISDDTLTLLKQETLPNSISFDTGREVFDNDYCKMQGNTCSNSSGVLICQCNAYKATDNFVNGSLSGPVKNNSSLYNYLNNEWINSLSYKDQINGDVLLPTKEQYDTLGGENVEWMNTTNSFWTMNAWNNSTHGYDVGVIHDGEYVNFRDKAEAYVKDGDYARPVITVKKQGLSEVIVPQGAITEDLSCISFDFETGTINPRDSSFMKSCAEDLIIPSEIGGVTVNKISDGAFDSRGLHTVVLPDTITSVGNFAFRQNSLTSVTLSNNATIGEEAFAYNKLTNVTIPNTVITIGVKAFTYNKLTSVIISDGVVTIGREAFTYNQLKNVTIPNTVTTIDEKAFSDNYLTSVTLSNNTRTIGREAFYDNDLTQVTIPDTVITIDGGAFERNRLTNVRIPSSVMNLESSAFASNQLTSVSIVGKSSSADFTEYGEYIWGWASGYNNSNIKWNAS